MNLGLGKPYLKVKVNGKPLKMELDTGSTLSCIIQSSFDHLALPNCKLEPSNERLCVSYGQFVSSVQKTTVVVEFKGSKYRLPLCVVGGKFPTLLGRDWIRVLMGEDWLSRMVDMAVNHVKSKHDFC